MRNFLFRFAVFALLFSSMPAHAQDVKSVAIKPDIVAPCRVKPAQSIDNLVGNYNNKIKIVFSDIDGTIMKFNNDNPKADAPESVKCAVKKLHSAKIPFVLATGRVYFDAKYFAEKMGNANTYLITQQGAEIRNPQGNVIYKDAIKESDAKNITAYLKNLKKNNDLDFALVLISDGKLYSTDGVKLPYILSETNQLKSYGELGNVTPTLMCVYDLNPLELRFIQANLKKKFPQYHIDISSHCFCDITSATATKGNAIKKMSELMGVDLKNAATLGDAENDISMLSLVKTSGGVSIAVGNAMDSVKASASFITLPVSDGGFAKAVDKILENNERLAH